jgi:hypothetical protein
MCVERAMREAGLRVLPMRSMAKEKNNARKQRMWKNLIERLWPLPAPEKRRLLPFLFVTKEFRNRIRPERDGDYLCWQVGALTQMIGVAFLGVLLVDLGGQFGWFLDLKAVAETKAYFVVAWLDVVGKTSILLGLLCYLRLRLPMDLKNEQIPLPVRKKAFRGITRRDWTQRTAFLAVLIVGMLAFPEAAAGGLMEMWNIQDNLVAVVIEQVAYVFLVPIAVVLGVSMALFFEKSMRFFPEAQADLENW